jgi:hypothetical protein
LKAKKKTKKAPQRFACWVAARSKKQCADKYFRSNATRERSSLYLAVLPPRQIRHLDRVCLISGTLLRAAEGLRSLCIPIADRCIILLLSTITRLLQNSALNRQR